MCKHDHAPEEGSDFDFDRKELEKDSKEVAKQAEEYMKEQYVLYQTHGYRRPSGHGPQLPQWYLEICKKLQTDE